MSLETIGKKIAAMRKEKGFRQEELATHVGVSTQAVSKWENGGVPDTELLPKIADFFSISVDSLFGRNFSSYGDVNAALCQKICETPEAERYKLVFEYCWNMERALFGHTDKDNSIEAYEKKLEKKEQRYSSIMSDYGFTRMGIANRLPYFLLVPEIPDTETAFFEGLNYPAFFKDFSDEAVFRACVLLYKRESEKAFTENLLIKHLSIAPEKAKEILLVLEKYQLVEKIQVELDDEIQTIYHFRPTPSFIAFLIFAREIIDPPHNFIYYSGCRNKPYLK